MTFKEMEELTLDMIERFGLFASKEEVYHSKIKPMEPIMTREELKGEK